MAAFFQENLQKGISSFQYYMAQLDKEVRQPPTRLKIQKQCQLSLLLLSDPNLLSLPSLSLFQKSQLSKYPALNKVEQQLGGVIPKAHGVVGILGVFSFFVFFNILAGFLTNLLGWGLPAYLSMKALESPGHDESVLVMFLLAWTGDRREAKRREPIS